MILSDAGILSALETGEIGIEPFNRDNVQAASLDCTLDNRFLTIKHHESETITLDSKIEYDEVTAERMIIPAKSFLLASTTEYIRLPNDITSFVEGRSSIGRMGLFIQNAGWVDSGFEGRITLELFNATDNPIELEAGRRICQLVFCRLDQPSQAPYRGKYFRQDEPVGSRVNQDNEVQSSTRA